MLSFFMVLRGKLVRADKAVEDFELLCNFAIGLFTLVDDDLIHKRM